MPEPMADGAPERWPRGVAAPARRALKGAGYTRLEQLNGIRAADLRRLHGLGPKALQALRKALAERGMALDEGG